MNPKLLAGIFLVYFAIGLVASELGYTTSVIEPIATPEAPASGGSFWDNISQALAPFAWVFNAVAGIFQMATFQTTGMPTLINSLIFIPIGFLVLLSVIRLVRGGG